MLKTFNSILLCIAGSYFLFLVVAGGEPVHYLQNIIMFLLPMVDKYIFEDTDEKT